MDLLINEVNFDSYKPLTKNLDVVKKLNPYIYEAQYHELSPLLSDDDTMLNDLLANPGTDPNKEILKFIEPALVHLAWALYLPNNGITHTASGQRKKKNEFSDAVDGDIIAIQIGNARSAAYKWLLKLNKYILNSKAADASKYPLYKPVQDIKNISSPVITAVSPTPDCDNDKWKYTY